MAYSDGTFTSPVQNGTVRRQFPFSSRQSADKYARIYTGEFVSLPGYDAPTTALRETVTNLLTYSEAFDNAAWTKTNMTATAAATANPRDGTVDACSVLETVTNSTHTVSKGVTLSATPTTFQVFLKYAGRQYVRLLVEDNASALRRAIFDLRGGTVFSSNSVTSASIYPLGSGWFQCWITFTPAAGSASAYIEAFFDSSTGSYAGDITKGFYAWGAQIVESATPLYYVKTTTTSAGFSAPTVYQRDVLAFLVEDGEAVGSGATTVTRKFATVPPQQTEYGSRTFVRPNYSGMKSGTTYAASLDGGRSIHHWTSRKEVLAVETNEGTTQSNTMGSGTVTVTFSDASTVTFAANASKGTIETAMAAKVGTGKIISVTVTVWSDGSALTIGSWYDSSNSFRITGVTGPSDVRVTNNRGDWSHFSVTAIGTTIVPDTKTVHCPSHGATAGNKAAMWSGDTLVATATVAGIQGSDYLTLIVSDLNSPELTFTYLTFDSGASARYNIEPAEVLTREVSDFYLPGITSGITTGADIPMATIYGSAQQFFDRIVAADTYTAVACSLEPWIGPIMVRKTVSVKMSSALQSMSVT